MSKVIAEISRSTTLPAGFYFDPTVWEQMKEAIFAPSWQYVGDEQEVFNVTVNT